MITRVIAAGRVDEPEITRLKNKLHNVAAILVAQTIKQPEDRINHALALMSMEPAATTDRVLTAPIRDRIAKAVCCGEHGRCILADCEPDTGQQTACIALKGYHDKTISAVLSALAAAGLVAKP